MKKIILTIVLFLVLTTSAFAVFDLTGYEDNHSAFLNFLQNTQTPLRLCDWMQANFTHTPHTASYTPYQQWVYKNGDCNDMSTLMLYWFHRHNAQSAVKQVYIKLSNGNAHLIAVWIGASRYWYSSNQYAHGSFGTIADCVTHYDNSVTSYVVWYNVYNYDYDLVSASKSPPGVPDVEPISCLE